MKRILFLILFASISIFAAEDNKYNQVNFSLNSKKTVKNDLLTVDMYIKEESKDAKKVAKHINQKMQRAFSIINTYSTIKSKTSNYSINPKYKESNIVGWTGRQDLHLESTDIDNLTSLMQELQNLLLVSGTKFSISKALNNKLKDRILIGLLKKFRAKAALITKELGAKEYQIVSLRVNNQRVNPPSYLKSNKAYSVIADSVPMPKLAAGEGELESTINATIELLF